MRKSILYHCWLGNQLDIKLSDVERPRAVRFHRRFFARCKHFSQRFRMRTYLWFYCYFTAISHQFQSDVKMLCPNHCQKSIRKSQGNFSADAARALLQVQESQQIDVESQRKFPNFLVKIAI